MNDLAVAKNEGITALLSKNYKAIKSMLPKHLTPERITRIAHTVINQSPKLKSCTELSLLNAILESSMLGLELGGPLGFAHLLPFGNKATLIIGYKGFMDLGYRSGRVQSFQFHPVYENDRFDYCYGLNPKLEHVPTEGEPGKLKYAYAIARYSDGGLDFEVVDERIAMQAKSHSAAKSSKDSPWNTDNEWAMWCKTAIRRLAKRIPQSPELQRAVALDERAEAGIDQGISHVIDADFTDIKQEKVSDLEAKIRGKEKPKKIQCPDNDQTIDASECNDCLKKQGCPAHE